MKGTDSEIASKEAAFHDHWAENTPFSQIQVTAAFEAATAPENRFILELLGPLKGKRLLDVGCGLGESSIYFAMKGAEVTALDISPKMVELTIETGKRNGVTIRGIVASIEKEELPAEYFDIVYLGNIIHHAMDRDTLFRNVRNTLRKGGTFVSWDPLAYNPVINVYRRIATEVRTPDESPLTFKDVALARKYFSQVGHREFWILSLVLFLKYYLIDRIDPNRERYWKRILMEPENTLGWFKSLQRIDGFLTRLPLVRRLAWNTVIWGTKDS